MICAIILDAKFNQPLILAHFQVQLLPPYILKLHDDKLTRSLNHGPLAELLVPNLLDWLSRALLAGLHLMVSIVLSVDVVSVFW